MRVHQQKLDQREQTGMRKFGRSARSQGKGEKSSSSLTVGKTQERGKKTGMALSTQPKNQYYTQQKSPSKNNLDKSEKGINSSKSQSIQYRQFNQRLHTIQDRIGQLRVRLQKKKLEKQKRQALRQKIIAQRKAKLATKQANDRKQAKEVEKGRKKKTSTKLSIYISQEKTNKPSFKIEKLGGFVTQVPDPVGHPLNFNPYSPRNNIYYISQILKGYRESESIIREHLKNSIEFLGIFSDITLPPVGNRRLNLPVKQGYHDKITVIFDLDETLIHCNDDIDEQHDVELPILFPTGERITAGINVRPYAKKILADLAKSFEIIIFTASHPCYANVVIDYLDPLHQYIQHRLYRQHCYLVPGGGPYVKDLRIINRDEKKMVLVDNAAYSYAFQPDNGIPIIPYYQGQNDYELTALKQYLNQLRFVDDVRQINRKVFKLRSYPEYFPQHVDKMVGELYGKIEKA